MNIWMFLKKSNKRPVPNKRPVSNKRPPLSCKK